MPTAWLLKVCVALSVTSFQLSHSNSLRRRNVLAVHSPLEDSLLRFRKDTIAGSSLIQEVPLLANTTVRRPIVECYIQSEAQEGVRGIVRVTVHDDLSPAAAAQFLALASSGYYDGVYVFRVLKGFVAQFGLRPKWAGWNGPKFKRVQESKPFPTNALSNTRGTVAFAGGSPTQVTCSSLIFILARKTPCVVDRTAASFFLNVVCCCKVFVNLGPNQRLDEDGRPFGLLDAASLAVVDRLYTGYTDGDGQVGAVNQSPTVVRRRFPNMSWVESCHLSKP
jgi:cyclophilin family peptidyl-prolyl cis-trans isomerase